jgi:hypothetical protein
MKGKSLLCLPFLLLVACQPNQSKLEQDNKTAEVSIEHQNADDQEAEKAEQALVKNAQLTASQMENTLLQQQESELQGGSASNEPALIDAALKKQAELESDLINRAKAEFDKKQAQLEQMASTEKLSEEVLSLEKPAI